MATVRDLLRETRDVGLIFVWVPRMTKEADGRTFDHPVRVHKTWFREQLSKQPSDAEVLFYVDIPPNRTHWNPKSVYVGRTK